MDNKKRIKILNRAIKLLENGEQYYMCYAIASAYNDIEEIYIDIGNIPKSTCLQDYIIDNDIVNPYELFPELEKYCADKKEMNYSVAWSYALINGEEVEVNRITRILILEQIKNEIQEKG